MASLLPLVRVVLYATAIVFSLLPFALAAGSVAVSVKDWGFYYQATAELIAAGVLAFVFLPVLLFFHLRQSTSILGSVSVELSVLGALWLLLLGGAAALASDNGDFRVLNYVEDFHGFHDALVPLTQATEAFAFLSWITVLAVWVLVLAVSVTNHLRGDKGVWTSALYFGESTSSSKSTGVIPAPAPASTPAPVPAAAPAPPMAQV